MLANNKNFQRPHGLVVPPAHPYRGEPDFPQALAKIIIIIIPVLVLVIVITNNIDNHLSFHQTIVSCIIGTSNVECHPCMDVLHMIIQKLTTYKITNAYVSGYHIFEMQLFGSLISIQPNNYMPVTIARQHQAKFLKLNVKNYLKFIQNWITIHLNRTTEYCTGSFVS